MLEVDNFQGNKDDYENVLKKAGNTFSKDWNYILRTVNVIVVFVILIVYIDRNLVMNNFFNDTVGNLAGINNVFAVVEKRKNYIWKDHYTIKDWRMLKVFVGLAKENERILNNERIKNKVILIVKDKRIG